MCLRGNNNRTNTGKCVVCVKLKNQCPILMTLKQNFAKGKLHVLTYTNSLSAKKKKKKSKVSFFPAPFLNVEVMFIRYIQILCPTIRKMVFTPNLFY